jgi:translation initiation factor RLI1
MRLLDEPAAGMNPTRLCTDRIIQWIRKHSTYDLMIEHDIPVMKICKGLLLDYVCTLQRKPRKSDRTSGTRVIIGRMKAMLEIKILMYKRASSSPEEHFPDVNSANRYPERANGAVKTRRCGRFRTIRATAENLLL